MQIRRRGAGRNLGWDIVTSEQSVRAAKWNAASGEFVIGTSVHKDPTGSSKYYHELRLNLDDLVRLIKLAAGEGIKQSPGKIKDAVESNVDDEPAASLIKLLCCSCGYIPTVLPGAVAVKNQV